MTPFGRLAPHFFLPLLGLLLPWAGAVPIPGKAADLSESEIKALLKEGALVYTENLAGKLWPRLTVIRPIAAQPDEAFAIFTDVEAESTYLPGILESRITRRVDERTVEVRYVQNMPWPVANETMTILNRRERVGRTYTVHWKLVQGTRVMACEGRASFEPWSNATLMVYQTWVDPGFDIARWQIVRNIAARSTEGATVLIEKQIYQVKSQRPALFERLLAECRKAVGSP
ncbi:MAG: hypothetical protein J0L75_17815 [Spirochaetes bacterium]|nr:hypothetical protein [Spirochaetota bacterium]